MSVDAQATPKKSIPHLLAIDNGVALLGGFALSWVITPMDQAVMEKMSGKSTLINSLKNSGKQMATNPFSYARSPQYCYVFGTYLGTYMSKNMLDTYCKKTHQTADHAAFLKFWGVFAVNGGLSVFWKDPGLAKLFGKSAAKMPPTVYATWALRDGVHMLGAAVAPDWCEQKFGWTKDQWRVAQVLFPMLVQIVTTPIHLMGLDLYNEPNSAIGERVARVAKSYAPSTGLRMIRMFAPWSLGLLICRDLREALIGDG